AVRRVHRAPRRSSRSLVPDDGGAGGGQEDHHDRGTRPGRPASAASGVDRRAGAAVRLLPIGSDHVGRGAAGAQSQPERSGHRERDVGQHLPLRDVPEDQARDQARGAGGAVMKTSLTRRTFLASAAATGAALTIRFPLIDPGAADAAAAYDPNAALTITPDGLVTVHITKAE